ncbi:hypothetical protein [Pseudofulvimonas gallinarii]|uniref:Uncharacterized protein n=2 Tax=Pseudofulvimonas gallinarii TaxID=634155 RepID=A0A4R3LFK6_9GAMM|nr:hypothetical protein EDC25_11415 [Pseudofulvimonas gallinarii]
MKVWTGVLLLSAAMVTAAATALWIGVRQIPGADGVGLADADALLSGPSRAWTGPFEPAGAEYGPLPPAGTPLREIEETLLARLAGGDVRAGCRLYHEYRRCETLDTVDTLLQAHGEWVLEEGGEEDQADLLIAGQIVEERLGPTRSICKDFGVPDPRRYHDVLLQAARLGDSRAMVTYASTAGSPDDDFVRDAEHLLVWRQLAEPFLYRALHMGDPVALRTLADARTSSEPLLGALMDDDPVEPAAAALVLQRLDFAIQEGTADIRGLDASQRARAIELADTMYRLHFATVSTDELGRRRYWNISEPGIEYCDSL